MRFVKHPTTAVVLAIAPLLAMAAYAQSAQPSTQPRQAAAYSANDNAVAGDRSVMEAAGQSRTAILLRGNRVEIAAGPLARTLDLSGNRILLAELRVSKTRIVSRPSPEFQLTFHEAKPNQRPIGLAPGDVKPLAFGQVLRQWLKVTRGPDAENAKIEFPITETQSVQWTNPITIGGRRMAECFQLMHAEVSTPRAGVTRLNLRSATARASC